MINMGSVLYGYGNSRNAAPFQDNKNSLCPDGTHDQGRSPRFISETFTLSYNLGIQILGVVGIRKGPALSAGPWGSK